MINIFYAFLTFLSGFVIETACVYWVHYSERNKAIQTALCSMAIGCAQVLGIGESIHNPYMAILFVMGYGVGTYMAVKIKSKGK